jgi:hypothetical protein
LDFVRTDAVERGGEQRAVQDLAAHELVVSCERPVGMARAKRAIIDEPLPQHLRRPPAEAWQWPTPTAWLLGTKLLGSLRDIVLSSLVKIDLRNWMTAGSVIDLAPRAENDEPYYIDFLADTGDSQRLVYQLARLLKQERLEVKRWENGEENSTFLPRGSLLVLGGDTAYPIATHRRLIERVRAPFHWAHDELTDAQKAELERQPVTLLAVPGNHDYYDGLRGFEALAHSPPVVLSHSPTSAASPWEQPPPSEQPLRLAGYKLEQHASYFAAALPFGWQLWGLDVEIDKIDDRQVAFFQGAARWTRGSPEPHIATGDDPPPPPPDRLILVTSRPGFVYQGLSDHAKVIQPSLERLGLTAAFAHGGHLEHKRVRLDLSGDVHLYERYWGTDHSEIPDSVDQLYAARAAGERLPSDTREYEAPERYRAAGDHAVVRMRGNDEKPPTEAHGRTNYASVVSGLGGAFHHPSQVRRGTTTPCAAWPSAEHSAREIGVRLVDPYEMFRAGAVGIAGLLVATTCYLLGWSGANVLGVLFAEPSDPHRWLPLAELGLVAAMVGIVLAMIGLPIGAYYFGRVLARPIREMRPLDQELSPRNAKTPAAGWRRASRAALHWCLRAIRKTMRAWLRATRAATHWAPSARFLGLLGANPRSTWLFATTILAWGGTLGGWWLLGLGFSAVAGRVVASGLVVIDVIITILVVGMLALGAFRAGQKSPVETWRANIVRRIGLALFGVVIAVLVVWTPYAWIRLICCHWAVSLIGLVVALLTMCVRFGHWLFRRSLRARQIATWIGFALLVAGAVLLPLLCPGMRGAVAPSPLHQLLMLALVPGLGAYFACLWIGWYFCICLQWDRHGNEAGSAARVTDFGAFLRIKLTADRAEVWAISVEEPLHPKPSRWCRLLRRKVRQVEPMPTARLIDHFTVERMNATRVAPGPS